MSTFNENLRRLNDGEGGILVFLEITSPVDPTVLRLVNDNMDHTFQGNSFIGYPFKFDPPPEDEGSYNEATLQIDNVGRDLMVDLEKLGPNEILGARVIISSRNTPNIAAMEFNLPITNVSANMQTITARCGYKYLGSQQAVMRRMSPFYTPGIFRT